MICPILEVKKRKKPGKKYLGNMNRLILLLRMERKTWRQPVRRRGVWGGNQNYLPRCQVYKKPPIMGFFNLFIQSLFKAKIVSTRKSLIHAVKIILRKLKNYLQRNPQRR